MKGKDPAVDAREKAFSRLATRYMITSTLFTTSSATCLQPAGAVCLQTPTVKVVLLQTSFWPQAYQGTYMACPWMRMPYSMIHVQGSIEAFQCP